MHLLIDRFSEKALDLGVNEREGKHRERPITLLVKRHEEVDHIVPIRRSHLLHTRASDAFNGELCPFVGVLDISFDKESADLVSHRHRTYSERKRPRDGQ